MLDILILKIKKIIMWLFNKKIKAKKFYNTDTKVINISGIKANIPNDKIPINFELGSIDSKTVPIELSQKLYELDLMQYNIANAINSLGEGEEKEKKKGEYIDTLLKMFELIQQNTNTSSNNIIVSKEVKEVSSSNLNSTNLYESLQLSEHTVSNIQISDFDKPGLIIWPVALKKRLSIIHQAQIEIIRVLQTKKWKLKVLIADCGIEEYSTTNFKKQIIKHLTKRNIEYESIEVLSLFFDTDYKDEGDILSIFIKISNDLPMNRLSFFNKKDDSYSEDIKDEIEKRPVLKYIQPVLTWSVVLHLSKKFSSDSSKRTIVVAGKDEEKQWRYVLDKIHPIGAIFIPVLKIKSNGNEYTASQEKLSNFFSEDEVLKELDNGNLSKWLLHSFIQLPQFPMNPNFRNMGFCNKGCKPEDNCLKCLFPNQKNESLPDFVDKKIFVKQFWDIINPA